MANKKSVEKIRKVYEYIAAHRCGLTVKEIAKDTELNVATVRDAREFLVRYGFIRVVGFGARGTIVYEPTTETWLRIFGSVSSITSYDFSCVVEVDGYGFDVDGEKYSRKWRVLLDTQIMKDIADYVKTLPAETPFF